MCQNSKNYIIKRAHFAVCKTYFNLKIIFSENISFNFCLPPQWSKNNLLWLSWILWGRQKLQSFWFFWPPCIYLLSLYFCPKQNIFCKFLHNNRLPCPMIPTLSTQWKQVFKFLKIRLKTKQVSLKKMFSNNVPILIGRTYDKFMFKKDPFDWLDIWLIVAANLQQVHSPTTKHACIPE